MVHQIQKYSPSPLPLSPLISSGVTKMLMNPSRNGTVIKVIDIFAFPSAYTNYNKTTTRNSIQNDGKAHSLIFFTVIFSFDDMFTASTYI